MSKVTRDGTFCSYGPQTRTTEPTHFQTASLLVVYRFDRQAVKFYKSITFSFYDETRWSDSRIVGTEILFGPSYHLYEILEKIPYEPTQPKISIPTAENSL